ncbi:Endonuclease/exonuclease/phosphatase [Mrakia frigida]|uniref:phosphatidylinositol-3-/phosphoinositide 5-phosphatase INP53 n=1 Tax=Mrakia frigida TaxID=29902 RepID=UPI003FCBFD64
MQLYIKKTSPRHLILVPSSSISNKALLLRQKSPTNHHLVSVEFVPTDSLELEECVRWPAEIVGVAGLVGGGGSSLSSGPGVSPDKECFLVVVERASRVGEVRPGTSTTPPEPISKVVSTSIHSLSSSTWDSSSLDSSLDPSIDSSSSSYYSTSSGSSTPLNLFEHPLSGMKKILDNGSFYFADPGSEWDVSSRLDERVRRERGEPGSLVETMGGSGNEQEGLLGKNWKEDRRFVWNEFLLGGLREFREGLESDEEREEFDLCGFLIPMIQGFVSSVVINAPGGQAINLAVVSRLSWRRAGTRFNTRGVDDEGNAAAFVETETVFSAGDVTMSWVQVRGSVPVFWEQQGIQAFGQKIQITRPAQASQPAFDKHFEELLSIYGPVHAVNLLGQKDNEVVLTQQYQDHLRRYTSSKPPPPLVGMTSFDFHAAVKVNGVESVRERVRRLDGVRRGLEEFGWTCLSGGEVVEEQRGVFRTNCLDCLDRTNVICEILSATVLENFMRTINPQWINLPNLWTAHSHIWADTGDQLSKVYAGTGALNTSFIRSGKRTLGGLLSDASKSVGRAYINTFTDKSKQVAIDMLLGMLADQRQIEIFDPVNQQLKRTLLQRAGEYSSTKNILVFTGTWNLNGKPPGESLLPWLFPSANSSNEPDIFSIAFQEIVPLTAQQIVQTDPQKIRIWEKFILGTFANRPNKKNDYILLRSEQLVGTALLVLIKSSLAQAVRKVEGSSKKTGLRGMSGNKGGVAIRMDFHDTSLCFVTAHFAAGHTNVAERNADYWTIASGLRFQKGKTIASHDIIFWAGDFNYRIDLANEDARELAETDNLTHLIGADQLTRAMDKNEVFGDYEEGEISFRPTYKYDNGTDNYDSSEKARIPSYTDRVLWRGISVEQIVYARAGLRTSDHRPVLGLFRASVQIIDKEKKAAMSSEIKQGLVKQMDGSGDISDGMRSLRVDSFEVDGRELAFPPFLLLRFASASLSSSTFWNETS